MIQEWVDLSDKYFVLLGAGSAMGPLLVLLSLGANVIAVDLNRSPIWERLIGLARNSCGKMIFPLSKPQVCIKRIRNTSSLHSRVKSRMTRNCSPALVVTFSLKHLKSATG